MGADHGRELTFLRAHVQVSQSADAEAHGISQIPPSTWIQMNNSLIFPALSEYASFKVMSSSERRASISNRLLHPETCFVTLPGSWERGGLSEALSQVERISASLLSTKLKDTVESSQMTEH